MKLLYCIPALNNAGGMERVLTEKVNYLINRPDYAITIVTTEQKNRDIRFALDKRIRVVNLDLNFNDHFENTLFKKYVLHKTKLKSYKQKLTELITELNIDICISLCGKEIEFLSDLNVSCKKVAEIHFSMNNRMQFIMSRHNGFIWKSLGKIRTYQLKKSVSKIDKLIVLTQKDKTQWERTHNNIICIPNPNPLSNQTVANLDRHRVITVGKLDAQKGYDILINVWALVHQKFPFWKLDIFGVGEWNEMLYNRICELDLSDSVKLCGLTNNVTEEYLKSSIYVMSSRYEGLPMVLIEAMSCGLPLVSFDCEYGPSEIITDAVDGFLVEENNLEKFAAKICLLIENDELRKDMGNMASINVQRYSKDKIMNQWIGLFESLVTN